MTAPAILMMLVAVLIVWGGLVSSTVFMVKNPLNSDPHPHDEHVFDRHPHE
ncbi:MAG: methionine/alanine import family NSS transporter small subunit [Actinomycetes bacterium]